MEYELYHYGRKGMKWYQRIFTKRKEARAKKRNAQLEKDRENAEERKQAIRNSRSAKQVYDNAHLFTDKELTEIYNRLNTEENIRKLIPEKVNKGKKFVENASSTLKTIGEGTKNFNNMITQFQNIGKLFGGGKASSGTSSAASKPGEKNSKSDKSSKAKETASKIFEAAEVITPKRESASSNSQPKSKTIIDAEWWEVSDNATSVAKSLTSNVGSRTVGWAMNNPSRIESGSSFVGGMLSLPAPKDRD